jgi:hypothetical protein
VGEVDDGTFADRPGPGKDRDGGKLHSKIKR